MALMMMIMFVDDDLLTVDSFGEDPNANIHSQIMSLCFLVDLAGIPEVPTRDELNPNRAPFYLTTSNNHHYQMRFSTIFNSSYSNKPKQDVWALSPSAVACKLATDCSCAILLDSISGKTFISNCFSSLVLLFPLRRRWNQCTIGLP